MTGRQARDIVTKLRRWYKEHRRDLPWRIDSPGYLGGPDRAYAVWVSELMLQQTRVETVVDYYPRFIERFPTVATLAEASIDDVLRLWQGLGYYARARHLHQAARIIVEQHEGRTPADLESLLALPGVGKYTAGAIASIGHGRRAAAVDGNIARVLARLLAVNDDIMRSSTQRRLWEAAELLVPKSEPGLHNEAMMELGSRICKPRRPSCEQCPIRQFCRADRENLTDRLPVRATPSEPKDVVLACAAVWSGDRFLMVQREMTGIWAGLWELPTIEVVPTATPRSSIRRHLTRRLDVNLGRFSPLGELRHALSHRRLHFHAFGTQIQAPKLRKNGTGVVWIEPQALDRLAIPTAHQKLIRLAIEANKTGTSVSATIAS
jgi:A/G-specific adenine glycosylase